MDRIKKHRSHIKGKIGCKPFGKYQENLKKKEAAEWVNQKEKDIIHEDNKEFANHIRIVKQSKNSKR